VAEGRRADSLCRPLGLIPTHIAGWTGYDDEPLAGNAIHALRASSYLSRRYTRGKQDLGLFIAYYREQRAGESMHSPKHCLPGAGWEIWDYDTVRVPLPDGAVSINKYSIQNGSDRALVFYWYQSRSRVIASEYLGKLFLARDALMNESTAAAIVRITLIDEPGAVQSGVEFASEIIPQLQRCLTGMSRITARASVVIPNLGTSAALLGTRRVR